MILEDILMKKRDLHKILFLICFWEVCAIFITYYDASILGFKSEVDGGQYNFMMTLFAVVITTLVGSTILGSLEVLYLGKKLRKRPLGISLLIKTTIYIISIFFFSSFAILFIYSSEIGQPMFSDQSINQFVKIFLSARVFSTMLYWGFACMMALFILQVNEKFGQGILLNFLLGKYHKPKEDHRIFMFMDLKSSTSHAEKLGHIKYSQLIQDCFFDLTDIVLLYEAKIYQYVGDEVVLSWEVDKGLSNQNCIKIYFAYDRRLEQKSDYYKNRYGIVPEFKAGLNLGPVTVAEVGEIKKELAYHGDVLNTAARIQSKCNDFQKKVLISEQLKSQIEEQTSQEFEFLGDVLLKGKKETVNIYAVNTA
jgi:adenylate cyclase